MLHIACTGIEPYYSIIQKRKYVDTSKYDGTFKEVTLIPLEFYDYSDEKLEWVNTQTAHKITPMQQIRILQAIQDFCHTAASKTINLPEKTTVQEIKDILLFIKDTNLKGVTMFRDSSIKGILSDDKKEKVPFSAMSRRKGETVKFKGANDTNLYITANKGSQGHIREIFMNTNWAGSEGYSMANALGRIISIALQKDFTLLPDIVKSLESVSADSSWTCPDLKGTKDGARLASIPMAIAATLQVLHEAKDLDLISSYSVCPTCKEKAYRRSGGCGICTSCGYSSC
jgi:ribonucleoside-diphosphate reductase alpha chain